MATIPRLPADNSNLTVSVTINKKLRPYLTKWFQETKQEGETPQTFMIRHLKEAAMTYYTQKEIQSGQMEAIESLIADSGTLLNEVE